MEYTFQYGMLLGGIGLFLLGMSLMTDGLKTASGPALIQFLEKYTNTKLKGFISGFISTTTLQSSTATTLLAIGFVNTGILTFANSLWLLFGANVGSTVMPWIIAIIGGGSFKISAFALPMIGIGIGMKMLSHKNVVAIGGVVAGFGLLFLGLDFLQNAFTGIEKIIPFDQFTGNGFISILSFALIGFILTVIMQSSAAVMAIILTLANSAGLPLTEAASAIIGANVGTTATALFATIGATANAKRAAWAHIGFNLIAGTAAFCILPFFVNFIDWLIDFLKMEDSISTNLALFHTTFNIFGVLLMIPLSGFMAKFLEKRFTKNEENIEKPKYIDDTLLDAPALAVESLQKELERYRDILISTLRGLIARIQNKSSVLPKVKNINELDNQITQFITKLTKSSMPEDIAKKLEECLYIRDQYRKSAEYLQNIISEDFDAYTKNSHTQQTLFVFLGELDRLLEAIDMTYPSKEKNLSHKKLEDFDEKYGNFKKSLAKNATTGNTSIDEMEKILSFGRIFRRMLYSFAKARKITTYSK